MKIYKINQVYDMQDRISYENGRAIVKYDSQYESCRDMYAKMVLHFMEHLRRLLSEFIDVSPDTGLDVFIMNTAMVMADAVIYVEENCD